MNQIQASLAESPSRLFSSALEVGLIEVNRAEGGIAEALGRLIDLSDSIALAEALRALARRSPKMEAQPVGDTDAVAHFMNVRGEILAAVASSFAADDTAPFLLPRADRDTLHDPQTGYSPFQRFYQLHQSEMERQIAGLRHFLRQTLAARSPRLAQLASLDKVVAEPLAEHTRRLLAGLPRGLGKRFAALRDDYLQSCPEAEVGDVDRWLEPGGWLQRFITEMQNLLLAELDFRLLPALGLLEAMEEEESPKR
ncbi:DUF3348 domain-containing protein [Spongiibacter taiwanensis]|uniref:DUF3348 family protein n=1 Tax=Spongiibacter taiwanensis TaxID=1748242 RepID=UPI002035B8EA|nr:DUF3348 family protein [Spongiibacter taiwanensis]USA44463.1 DUF3348 domain-containing protein [Spongiibacter taiwanensis]